jgi:hypothetical protein
VLGFLREGFVNYLAGLDWKFVYTSDLCLLSS